MSLPPPTATAAPSRVVRFAAWAARSAAGLAQNGLIVGGATFVAHGVARIYAPAGEIVLGGECIAFAFLLARGAR